MSNARNVLLLTAVVWIAGAWGCGDEPVAEIAVRPVLSVRVGDASVFSDRRYPGQARATQELDMAFEVPGRLIERLVDVGSTVLAGDELARLDPRDFEADFASARANEAKARADALRADRLLAADVIPPAEHEAVHRRLEVATAELRKAEKATEDTRLVAPFAGTVAATYVDNFQTVQAKQPVLRLLDATRIERLMRALAALGLLSQANDGSFALAPKGELLRSDRRDSLRNNALLRGGPKALAAWAELANCVRTGQTAAKLLAGVDDPFAAFDTPEARAVFDSAMAEGTPMVAGLIELTYDFSGVRSLVDVGGG